MVEKIASICRSICWKGTGISVEAIARAPLRRPFSRGDEGSRRASRASLFLKGLPLADQVDRRLAIDLELFSRGGLKVLEKIERQDYNVLAARPAISKVERVGIAARRDSRAGHFRAPHDGREESYAWC